MIELVLPNLNIYFYIFIIPVFLMKKKLNRKDYMFDGKKNEVLYKYPG